MVTAEIDYAPLNAQLDSLYNALVGSGKDASNLLVDETKRLVKTIVNFTPPMPKSGARTIGENAIRNDLESLIHEAPPELFNRIGSQYGIANIDAPLTKKNGEQVRLVWENLVANPGRLPELHNQYRTKNGRPGRRKEVEGQWRARIVVEKGQRDPYIRKTQANVGRWKAKWALGGSKLGDKYPSWISRHFDYAELHTTFHPDLSGEHPSIVLGGNGPDFKRNLSAIRGAVQFRAKAIGKRVQLILSGYAKDLAAGMRAKTRAHEAYGKDQETVE